MCGYSGDARPPRPPIGGRGVRAWGWTIEAAALLVGDPLPPPGCLLGSPPRASGTAGDDPAGRAVASGKGRAPSDYGGLTEGRKSNIGVLCGLDGSPLALQIPLPSVRLRLTASSPKWGKKPFFFPAATPRPAGPATQSRRGEDGPKPAACARAPATKAATSVVHIRRTRPSSIRRTGGRAFS